MTLVPSLSKALTRPFRQFFNRRFEALSSDVAAVHAQVRQLVPPAPEPPTPLQLMDRERLRQAEFLERVDVREQNLLGRPPGFNGWQSRAVSAAQCADPSYRAWYERLESPSVVQATRASADADGVSEPHFNRKMWEWACIAAAAEHAGVLRPGGRALGFGVGTEPLPAYFASQGMTVLATDQGLEAGQEWAATGQLLKGLGNLSRPHLVSDQILAERVALRDVDMNEVPDDLGSYDLIWSACCLEHLGSPARGLAFVERCGPLLRPGGVSVHTTELELTRKQETADYGNCAVYRAADLVDLAGRLQRQGLTCELNLYVALETRQDRWISLVLSPGQITLEDRAHLKLVIADSVSTSFCIIARHPG